MSTRTPARLRRLEAAESGYRRLNDVPSRSTATVGKVGLPRKADKIFDAALQQLAERGYNELTIEGIADAAGVNKTTLYRWWSGKGALLSAALRNADVLRIDEVPDTGTLRGDITDFLEQIATRIASPSARAVLARVIDGSEPDLACLAEEFVADRLVVHRQILAQAAARGEIAPYTTDGPSPFHPLIGAICLRVLMLRQQVDDRYLAELVDNFLTGFLSEAKPS